MARPAVVVSPAIGFIPRLKSWAFSSILCNATAFVLPFLGHNFGVGEEAGSILETLSETHGERFIFVHKDDVTSAMIQSAPVRWDVRIETYETEEELIAKLRRFAGDIMHRERRGDLPRFD
jgi:hypothetical protein